MDHIRTIAKATETDERDWEATEGPDTRCGVDYYYSHKGGMFARVNVDQGFTTYDVVDIDGNDVWSAS